MSNLHEQSDAVLLQALKDLKRLRTDLSAQFKAEDARFKGQLAEVESEFRRRMNEREVDCIRDTKLGTVYVKEQHRASITDFDAFIQYVITNEAYELLQRSVKTTAVMEMVDGGEAVPDGVSVEKFNAIGFRSR